MPSRRKAVVLIVLSILAASAVAAQSSGGEITIDFEEFSKGQILSTIPRAGSESLIRVYGVNPGFTRNAAVVFDSSEPGDQDHDLGAPNENFEVAGADGTMVPGPGRGEGGEEGQPCQNDKALGKILIVDDDLNPLTEEGLVEEPDDEGRIGSRLLLDFSEIGPVTIHGMTIIDVEEPDAEIRLYNEAIDPQRRRPSRKHQLAHYRVHTEDNGVARLFDPDLRNQDEGCHVTLVRRKAGEPLDPVSGVQGLEIGFSGSGGIARVTYSVQAAQSQ